MSDLRMLFRLQMLQAEQLKQQKRGGPTDDVKKLKQLKLEIENLQLLLKELKGQHQIIKEQGQHLAQNTRQLREQTSQINEKIYGGSLHIKEISSYQHKLTQLQEDVATLEDQELDIMQKQEDIKKEWQKKKHKLDLLTAEFKEVHQAYLKSKEETKSRAEALAREEKTLIKDIKPELLKEYLELKAKYPNPVSRVTKDICSGCHLGISYDKLKQLKAQKELAHCNHCGRILFWDPAADAVLD